MDWGVGFFFAASLRDFAEDFRVEEDLPFVCAEDFADFFVEEVLEEDFFEWGLEWVWASSMKECSPTGDEPANRELSSTTVLNPVKFFNLAPLREPASFLAGIPLLYCKLRFLA